MMKKRKLGLLLASVVLVAAIAVGATLAYFTDSDQQENVVTMGRVDISLTETSNDQTAIIKPEGITFTKVLPGDTLSKVPTVTVKDGSADCYIRVKMDLTTGADSTITANDLGLLKTNLIAQTTKDGVWAYNQTEQYFYCTTSKTATNTVDLFQTVTIPAAWQNNVADQSFSIVIKAEAIQASYISYDATNICWKDTDGKSLTGQDAVEIQKYVAKVVGE